jgi:membrane protease subunit HflK
MENDPIYYRTIPLPTVIRYAVMAVIGLVLFGSLSTAFYTVDTDEQGVVQLFGKFVRVTSPGLHFKLPLGIETVTKIPVKRNIKQEFGYRTTTAGVKSVFRTEGYSGESLMLCGDLSVADVKWSVQYIIAKPEEFLFNVRNPETVIRDVSESMMRSAVGDSSVDEVLSERRSDINEEVKLRMQAVLDGYGVGVLIDNITLQEVAPPAQVKTAFNEVNTAQQDKERLRNEAEKEYNTVVFKADGEAKQMRQQAQAYAVERVNEASGDAKRFTQVWEEYSQSKDVTRRRLYLESLGRVLPRLEKKYIIDEDVKGLLPLMNVGEVSRAK